MYPLNTKILRVYCLSLSASTSHTNQIFSSLSKHVVTLVLCFSGQMRYTIFVKEISIRVTDVIAFRRSHLMQRRRIIKRNALE